MPGTSPADTGTPPPGTGTPPPGTGTPPPGTGAPGGAGTQANTAGPQAQLPLYLRMFMDKNIGLTIEVLDASGINQQSITMDGTRTVSRVSSAQGDSVITQTADSVSIETRNFSVQAENIRMSSSLGTNMQSMGRTTVSSLSDIALLSTGSLALSGLSGIGANGMSISLNAMQSVTAMAVGGGVSLVGGAAGVQLVGSDISLTGVAISITAPTMSVTSANLQYAAVPGPPQGSAATSGMGAAKGAGGAANAGSGAAKSLGSSGSALGSTAGSGMGGNASNTDTGGMLNLGATGTQGPTTSIKPAGMTPGVPGAKMPSLPQNSAANSQISSTAGTMDSGISSTPLGRAFGPPSIQNTWQNYTNLTDSLNPFSQGNGNLIQGGAQAYKNYTDMQSKMLKQGTNMLVPMAMLWPQLLPVLVAGYFASNYASALGSNMVKLSNGSLTAGDLMGLVPGVVLLKSIGQLAMQALKLLDSAPLGGGEDTTSLLPGLKPGDTDAVSGLMEKMAPPKELAGGAMGGTILQDNSSILATVLSKVQKKKLTPAGAPPPASGSKTPPATGTDGKTRRDALPGSGAQSELRATQSASKTGETFSPSPAPAPAQSTPGGQSGVQTDSKTGAGASSGTGGATPGDIPTIRSMIDKLDKVKLDKMAPVLVPQILTGLSKLLGPLGFVTVLGEIPGAVEFFATSSEYGELTRALLPPGYLPDPKTPASTNAAASDPDVIDVPPEESTGTGPSAPGMTPAAPGMAPAAPGMTPAAPGTAVPAPAAPNPAVQDPSAQDPSAAAPDPSAESGSMESELDMMLSLGGLMRNQWQLGMPDLGQAMPGLLPRGRLDDPLPGASGQQPGNTQGGAGAPPPEGTQPAPSSQGATPPGQQPAEPAALSDEEDDGGIDEAVRSVLGDTITALGPLGVSAESGLKLRKPKLDFLGKEYASKKPTSGTGNGSTAPGAGEGAASPATTAGAEGGTGVGTGTSPGTGMGTSPGTGMGTSPGTGMGTSPGTGTGASAEAGIGSGALGGIEGSGASDLSPFLTTAPGGVPLPAPATIPELLPTGGTAPESSASPSDSQANPFSPAVKLSDAKTGSGAAGTSGLAKLLTDSGSASGAMDTGSKLRAALGKNADKLLVLLTDSKMRAMMGDGGAQLLALLTQPQDGLPSPYAPGSKTPSGGRGSPSKSGAPGSGLAPPGSAGGTPPAGTPPGSTSPAGKTTPAGKTAPADKKPPDDQKPSDAGDQKSGGGGGGGTLLDEMKEKGSLLDGDYGPQFIKVLEKTYGTPNKGLHITLNPMDSMILMSGMFQGMMIPERQPYETASAFGLAMQPKTVLPETEMKSIMSYGQNTLEVQKQLASFMKDMLSGLTSKLIAEAKTDEKAGPPAGGSSPPVTDPKDPTETAPQTPAETEPQSPAETESQSPAETESQSPAEAKPQTPDEAEPQSPAETKPQPLDEAEPQSLDEADLQPLDEADLEGLDEVDLQPLDETDPVTPAPTVPLAPTKLAPKTPRAAEPAPPRPRTPKLTHRPGGKRGGR